MQTAGMNGKGLADRMRHVLLVAATALVAGGGWQPLRAQNFDKVEIQAQHVAGSVHLLKGAGGNIGVSAGPDGVLIVDDQFAPLAAKIRAALRKINPGELAFVLNTHYHGDHTGGNAEFSSESLIVAHDNVRKRLQRGDQPMGREPDPKPKEALPVLTFAQSVSIHFNDETIEVIHFPRGHTDGDSIVFFTGSNVVHMGDDMFAGMFPFVDLGGGGSVQGLIANVQAVLKRVPDDVKIIPGHGELSRKSDLKRYLDMLTETSDVVREGMRAGKSLQEIQAQGLPSRYDSWASRFIPAERWIETIHASYSRDVESVVSPPVGIRRSGEE